MLGRYLGTIVTGGTFTFNGSRVNNYLPKQSRRDSIKWFSQNEKSSEREVVTLLA